MDSYQFTGLHGLLCSDYIMIDLFFDWCSTGVSTFMSIMVPFLCKGAATGFTLEWLFTSVGAFVLGKG